MKKLISILAALAVVTTCSVVGFAEETVATPKIPAELTNELVKNPEGAENAGLYTVDLTSVANGQAQTTILAVKGEEISVGTIEYIGQDADPVFNFDLRNELKSGETVYVFAGGSDIPAQYFGYMAEEATEPELPPVETFTISGTISDDYAGTTLPTITITDGTNSYTVVTESTGVFSQAVNVGATYKLAATKAGHLKYTKENITAETTVNPVVKPGDLDGNDTANLIDIGFVVANYNQSPNNETKAYDVDENGTINLIDIGFVVANYNEKSITE